MPKPHTYHHGDLRHSLIDEAVAAARTGGASAIGIRELARTIGVSANAAYRHFADRGALVRAAAGEAQKMLAGAMIDRIERIDNRDPGDAAIERLRCVGFGYIDFARAEPGLFNLAFATYDAEPTPGIVTLEEQLVPPFRLLLDSLDELVRTGVLAAERRENAEWACWSAVHGFAGIAAFGPLRTQPDAVVDALAALTVDTVIAGVLGG